MIGVILFSVVVGGTVLRTTTVMKFVVVANPSPISAAADSILVRIERPLTVGVEHLASRCQCCSSLHHVLIWHHDPLFSVEKFFAG